MKVVENYKIATVFSPFSFLIIGNENRK